ncbi:transferase [Parabacteroides sp.]|uniref:transferase n=1 Tax=Parabacteroides sp. TaxID=1869337 RepID=UPI00259B82DB|nr:transferase [uncultured Parabacteroides sp.]
MNKEIYILGVGRNTIVTIDLAECCGYRVAGLYHYLSDRMGEQYFDHTIIGCNDELFEMDLSNMQFAISVGDNDIRAYLYNAIVERGGKVVTLIHPTAIVSKYATIGDGVCIHALSVVSPDVVIGNDCVISHNNLVTHGVRMENHCFMASNVILGANTVVDDFSFIGSGATIISTKVGRLGKHSYVGAGAVVTKPVGDGCVVVGNPAKIFKTDSL